MKQYTNESQTAKLIELGFEQQKSIEKVIYTEQYGCGYETAYSIGELIEMLSDDDVATTRAFEYDGFNWFVDWDSFDKIHQTMGVELVDALYDMVVKLKDEGVI